MTEMDDLREAWRDLAFTIFGTVGLLTLVRWLGMTPKDWIVERERRELWRDIR